MEPAGAEPPAFPAAHYGPLTPPRGTVLGGGAPLLTTVDNLRMAPSADGLWLFVLDGSGYLYGLSVDTTVPAIKAKAGRRVMAKVSLPRQLTARCGPVLRRSWAGAHRPRAAGVARKRGSVRCAGAPER